MLCPCCHLCCVVLCSIHFTLQLPLSMFIIRILYDLVVFYSSFFFANSLCICVLSGSVSFYSQFCVHLSNVQCCIGSRWYVQSVQQLYLLSVRSRKFWPYRSVGVFAVINSQYAYCLYSLFLSSYFYSVTFIHVQCSVLVHILCVTAHVVIHTA